VRVGIIILADRRWSDGSGRWRRAEEYGFAHAWTYDHIGWRDLVDGPWFDAVPTLSAAAAVTETIRLGTLVASPNFRHPVHFAREITALDDLSGGRFTVGVGAGGISGFDNDVLGLPPLTARQRADRFEEFLTLLDAILTNDRTSFSGSFYQAVDARSSPGCVQRPRVPFLVAGNGPRSMRLAATFGQGWVTTGTATTDHEHWWRNVAELAKRFDDLDPAGMVRALSVDAAPVYSLSSIDVISTAVERAATLGFTDLICHWPRENSWYAGNEAIVEQVAGRLPGWR
jgi:alkanesulfonate monooxygenase SsuD/methylene tetrahydromethanopterin reductase-like flavin-dependent oxidoreductase (luciferase family)